ncbi:TonB-dependent receptor [Parahaliea mediterranea]|uniref:TonB-dependent receptor n=1 Tax=Parahaliea mediterranea TaxID=651086 RepID=UPI000E2FAED4|nr:TonB-dependent receptor [Parahaliea mediterranea]
MPYPTRPAALGGGLCALAAAVLTTSLLPARAAAQDSAGNAEDHRVIEEVIVSVRYREESLQTVPSAVTAFDTGMLEDIVALDFQDLSRPSPNVNIQQVNQFPNAAAVHIRGIGDQRIESTEEPRAGISIDGLFFTRPGSSNIDFFDLASVQILRGPTGVNFGKNSLAGGMAVETIQPSGELGGKVDVNIGNYGREEYRMAVDSPKIADWAFRLSYLYKQYDGHFKNRFDGTPRGAFGVPEDFTLPIAKELGAEDVSSGRLQGLWTPSDNVDLRLIYNWVRDKSDPTPGDTASDDGSDPRFPAQLACILQEGCPEPDDGPYRLGRDYYSRSDIDQDAFTGILNWDFGGVAMTAIAGYIETDDLFLNDFDQTEFFFFPTSRDQTHDQTSFELRFTNSDDSGRLDWVVGAFYMEQEHELTQNFPTLGFTAGDTFFATADYTTQKAESQALFGQVIYAINDRLNLTAGLRYTDEQKDFYRDPAISTPAITYDPNTHFSYSDARALARQDLSDDILSDLDTDHTDYKLALDYQLGDNAMVYGQVATGFKAGEFGARANSPETALPTDDEEAISYEIGLKSELWDNRLRLNLAAFWASYENLQFGVFVPSANVTGQETLNQNVGEATTKGIELDLSASLTDRLTVNLNAGYLDASYDEFCADLNGASAYPTPPTSSCGSVTALTDGTYLVEEDQSDLELSRAPSYNYHVSGEYDLPLPDGWGGLVALLSYTYSDEYFSDSTINHPKGKTGGFGTWDGSLAWSNSSRALRVALWGKNLTDEEEVSGLTPTANFFNQRFWYPPRTYGVNLSYTFE